MADPGNFRQLGLRPASAHLLPGIARQQVGFGAAHDQGRTGDAGIDRPQVDVLVDECGLEGFRDTRVVAEGPAPVRAIFRLL